MLVLLMVHRALFLLSPVNATFLSVGFMKTPVTTCSVTFKELHDWLALQ